MVSFLGVRMRAHVRACAWRASASVLRWTFFFHLSVLFSKDAAGWALGERFFNTEDLTSVKSPDPPHPPPDLIQPLPPFPRRVPLHVGAVGCCDVSRTVVHLSITVLLELAVLSF